MAEENQGPDGIIGGGIDHGVTETSPEVEVSAPEETTPEVEISVPVETSPEVVPEEVAG